MTEAAHVIFIKSGFRMDDLPNYAFLRQEFAHPTEAFDNWKELLVQFTQSDFEFKFYWSSKQDKHIKYFSHCVW